MSVAVALTISVCVNAPLFSSLTGCLYLSKQLRKLFFLTGLSFILEGGGKQYEYKEGRIGRGE